MKDWDPVELLRDDTVRSALSEAWAASAPSAHGGHEEGGFVLIGAGDTLTVVRWPVGARDEILVPEHRGCQWEGSPIVASFHTHPNTGPDYLQEPGDTDCDSVRDDPDWKGSGYIGEDIIADREVYFVRPSGRWRTLGDRTALLGVEE